MARIGNARTISDIEYVIDAPGPGGDQAAWIAHGVECARDRHRFTGQSYSFSFEVLSLRFNGSPRNRWHAVIISELWRFADASTEARSTKSLKVLKGKSADVLIWMRRHRTAKLEQAFPPKIAEQ
jgi:hypothetical protein